MPVVSELIAHNRTEEQVAATIGADRLFYQTVDDLIDAVRKGNPRLRAFDTSCFTGDYVTGGVTSDYLEQIALARNDAAKEQQLALSEGPG